MGVSYAVAQCVNCDMRKPDFCLCNDKSADQLTVKLISAFVFATQMVQFLFFLNLKFQASSLLLSLYKLVFVGAGRKPRRPVFSRPGSCMLMPFFMTVNVQVFVQFLPSCQAAVTTQRTHVLKLHFYASFGGESQQCIECNSDNTESKFLDFFHTILCVLQLRAFQNTGQLHYNATFGVHGNRLCYK